MAVNVKMGVDLSGFKSGIQQGTQILKGLNSEMKAAEAEFKATGNAEQLMANKTKTLNSQIQVQKGIVDQAKTALQQMTDAGVDPADKAYQSMYATMMKAQAGMYEAQAALNGLNTSAQEAATGADKLTNSVNSIGKKISLDQVISGIGSITGALESAASKAVELGEKIWSNILDSARLADDTATQAMYLDMSVEQYQQYKGVFDTIAELTVSDWSKAKRKVEKAMTDPSNDQVDVLKALGFITEKAGKEGTVQVTELADNWEQVFWDAAEALKKKVESGEIGLEQADMFGEALFGKNYSLLKPLIDLGQEGFTAALNDQNVASEEAIKKDAELNDAVIKLQNSYDALKMEVTSGLAPALTDAANALDGVLGKILEYLKTEEGQEMLGKLGDAVAGLFGDLEKIDPEKVVAGFVEVFTKVTDGIQWLVDNEDTAKGILATIVGAWGTLTIGENVLKVVKLVEGIQGMTGASGEIAAAGAAAGASWGGAFAAAVLAAAPWLLALLAKDLIPEENQINNEKRVESADASKEEIQRLKEWVEVQNKVLQMEDKMFTDDFDEAEYEKLAVRASELGNQVQQGDLWSKYWDYIVANDLLRGGNMPTDVLDKMLASITESAGEDGVPIRVDPQPPVDTPEKIKEEVGVVHLDADLTVGGINFTGLTSGGTAKGGGGGGPIMSVLGYANGLPYVPSDGLYRLHRGERVTPAREAGRSFSSNLYVENMNMNGGLSADALAASIAARNQRMMSGYGS